MNNLSAADIDCYMVNVTFTVTVEDQISRLQFRSADLRSFIRLRSGRMTQGNTVFFEHCQYKTGAVGTLGQAGPSPYVRVTHELFRIFHQVYAHIGYTLAVEQLRHGNGGIQLLFHCDIFLGHISILTIDGYLHPAIGTGLHIFHFLALSYLRHDLAGGVGFLAYIQSVRIGNCHRMYQLCRTDRSLRSGV